MDLLSFRVSKTAEGSWDVRCLPSLITHSILFLVKYLFPHPNTAPCSHECLLLFHTMVTKEDGKNKCPGKWFPLVGSIWLHDRFTILAWRMDGTREAIILITGSFLLLELWLYLQVQIPWWKGWILRMRCLLNSSSFAQVVSSACSTYWQKIPIFPKILLLKILIHWDISLDGICNCYWFWITSLSSISLHTLWHLQ